MRVGVGTPRSQGWLVFSQWPTGRSHSGPIRQPVTPAAHVHVGGLLLSDPRDVSRGRRGGRGAGPWSTQSKRLTTVPRLAQLMLKLATFFFRHLILKSDLQKSFRNNTKNSCTPFTRIPQCQHFDSFALSFTLSHTYINEHTYYYFSSEIFESKLQT